MWKNSDKNGENPKARYDYEKNRSKQTPLVVKWSKKEDLNIKTSNISLRQKREDKGSKDEPSSHLEK